MPKPPAAFSPLMTTKSSFQSCTRAPRRSSKTARPLRPTMSPMKRMRIRHIARQSMTSRSVSRSCENAKPMKMGITRRLSVRTDRERSTCVHMEKLQTLQSTSHLVWSESASHLVFIAGVSIMPRKTLPPRLWLRPAANGQPAEYLILDRGKQVRVGTDKATAERALSDYLVKDYDPRAKRPGEQKPVADALLLY